ncbi:hypothetical protein ASF92_19555 [Pedobacter sp. Leaf176]|nr:hypothetical protein ASF92_19555 [Pedobacter sp. Leaf176]
MPFKLVLIHLSRCHIFRAGVSYFRSRVLFMKDFMPQFLIWPETFSLETFFCFGKTRFKSANQRQPSLFET